MNATRRPFLATALTAIALSFGAFTVSAADLPADVVTKVEKAQKRLVELAADASILAAVREANGRDTAGMNNGKWSDLADTDAAVTSLLRGKVSGQIVKWEAADASVNKVVLRDLKGNIVGASVRPLIYNNATRPVFANSIKGQPWAAGEIKPDPTTQVPGVQISVPVLDGGKTVGVLHASVSAK